MLKRKKNAIIIAAIFVVMACLVMPQAVRAGVDDVVINISSWIAQQIIYVVGQLLLIAIHILIKVAGFNEFVGAKVVEIGWVIVRDIANLGIVIALLIIAFYTVLNKQSYHYKTMLPKLVLAAILVNFSKTIAGLLIDFGQVIMMTFVHAFQDIAAGNLTYGFGLEDMLSVRKIAEGAGEQINDWNVFGALVLGVIMMSVALGVIVSMVVMLLYRIVMLWILIVFSPIAYVAGLIPGGSKYASQWWENFSKYIVFGPVLAFMFWLSMSVLSQITTDNRLMRLDLDSQRYFEKAGGAPVDYAYFASQVSSPQRVFDYMVTVALLIACLITAQRAGVMGASFAGTVSGKLQGAGSWIARRPQTWGRGLAGAGLRRLGTSYAAEGVRALVQRGKTSWVGQKVGLDKEYTARQAAKRRARLTEWVGGKRGAGAIRSFEYQQAMAKQKEMEEKGLLGGGEDALRKLLHTKIETKKMDEARAIMTKMSSDKDMNLKKEDYDKYEKALGVTRKSDTRKERDMMMYFESLAAAQKTSGDAMAKYKTDVTRDSAGNLMYADKVAQVNKDFAEKREADFNNIGIFKAFDENLPEFRAILNQLDKKTDMQALGTSGRREYAKIAQKMLARHYDKSDNFDLEKLEGPGAVDKYTNLLQKMHAKKFVTGTGEAILDEEKAEVEGHKKHIREGNKNFAKAMGFKFNEDSGELDTSVRDKSALDEVAEEHKKKKAEKEKEDKFYGREILTQADKSTDENVVRPLMIGNEIQSNLYKAANEGRGGEPASFVANVGRNIKGVDKVLQAEANRKGFSNVINPEKGTPYSQLELYWKSDVGKNIDTIKKNFRPVDYKNLSPDKQKDFIKQLEDKLDIISFDAERSVTPTQKAKLEEKSFGQVKREKILKNRIVNRNNLGLVTNSIARLKSEDLTQRNRKKLIGSVKSYLKQARKHSNKWNSDNVDFNQELEKLEKESKGIAENKVNLDDFATRVQSLLNQVEAK